ncbi:tripartite tricarboxylate transporter TctB family protein [Betaproteobacteria bacterium PRO7]|jgi:putative tricarboxylic transport membrane protein|nr:tripartite tricarboxylate transporter TctB family protein [Betaproteobacteria bacterium PRO7]
MTSDRILGAVCVATAVAMAGAASRYVPEISYEPIGPRAFPTLLAVLIGLAGAWLVIRPSRHSGAVAAGRLPLLAGCMGAIFVYALLFRWLGFTLATALMAVPVGIAFGGNWRQSLAAGVGLGFGLYLLFDKLLDVVLPTGVLSIVLGGR